MDGNWEWGLNSNKEDRKIYGSQSLRSGMVSLLEERGFIVNKRFKRSQQQVQKKDKSPISVIYA